VLKDLSVLPNVTPPGLVRLEPFAVPTPKPLGVPTQTALATICPAPIWPPKL